MHWLSERSGFPRAALLPTTSLSQWPAREPLCYSHSPISLPREAMPAKNHCKTLQERPTGSTSSPLQCSTTGRSGQARRRGPLYARGRDERTLMFGHQRPGRRRSTGGFRLYWSVPEHGGTGARYRRLRRRRAVSDSAHSDGCPLAAASNHLDERAGSFLPTNSGFFHLPGGLCEGRLRSPQQAPGPLSPDFDIELGIAYLIFAP